ncbi:MAG: response regulator [Bryobacteraceae bacterium]|nr:response regulator [Bryobacteraceae bacterium]
MTGVPVLVVDDEPALRKFLQIYLERVGYSVSTAETAEQALETFSLDTAAFRIIIADLSLPGMQGDEMARQMVSINPELRVLLCSGYPYAVESFPELIRDKFAVLQKPFLPNELAGALTELLKR